MRTQSVRWGLALFATAVGLGTLTWAQGPTPARPIRDAKPISVASFSEELPVGHLGVQLGTVVRVTGEAFDGNTTGAKTNVGKTLLRIVTVNGEELAKPVVFAFHRAAASVVKPLPGEQFDYYVHEYGEFDGVVEPPKVLGINKLPFANDGFCYRRHLTVHYSNAVGK